MTLENALKSFVKWHNLRRQITLDGNDYRGMDAACLAISCTPPMLGAIRESFHGGSIYPHFKFTKTIQFSTNSNHIYTSPGMSYEMFNDLKDTKLDAQTCYDDELYSYLLCTDSTDSEYNNTKQEYFLLKLPKLIRVMT